VQKSLTKHYLTEPETAEQTARIVATEFEERLKQGFG